MVLLSFISFLYSWYFLLSEFHGEFRQGVEAKKPQSWISSLDTRSSRYFTYRSCSWLVAVHLGYHFTINFKGRARAMFGESSLRPHIRSALHMALVDATVDSCSFDTPLPPLTCLSHLPPSYHCLIMLPLLIFSFSFSSPSCLLISFTSFLNSSLLLRLLSHIFLFSLFRLLLFLFLCLLLLLLFHLFLIFILFLFIFLLLLQHARFSNLINPRESKLFDLTP